jgi:hypothetical protein
MNHIVLYFLKKSALEVWQSVQFNSDRIRLNKTLKIQFIIN